MLGLILKGRVGIIQTENMMVKKNNPTQNHPTNWPIPLINTLEQLVIAIGVYSAWCILMPSVWLSAVPLCSVLFVIGRILFFKGYNQGAAARAFGFALTFYSTIIMFLVLLGYQLVHWISSFWSKLKLSIKSITTLTKYFWRHFSVFKQNGQLNLQK